MTEGTRESSDVTDGICVFPRCEKNETDRLSLPLCNWHIVKVHRHARFLIEEVMEETAPEPMDVAERPAPATTPGALYFIRLGTLVKIGFSTSLAQRLRALPHEEVLAVTTGTMRDERALHQRFAHLRQHGEWFNMADDLTDYINELNRAA